MKNLQRSVATLGIIALVAACHPSAKDVLNRFCARNKDSFAKLEPIPDAISAYNATSDKPELVRLSTAVPAIQACAAGMPAIRSMSDSISKILYKDYEGESSSDNAGLEALLVLSNSLSEAEKAFGSCAAIGEQEDRNNRGTYPGHSLCVRTCSLAWTTIEHAFSEAGKVATANNVRFPTFKHVP